MVKKMLISIKVSGARRRLTYKPRGFRPIRVRYHKIRDSRRKTNTRFHCGVRLSEPRNWKDNEVWTKRSEMRTRRAVTLIRPRCAAEQTIGKQTDRRRSFAQVTSAPGKKLASQPNALRGDKRAAVALISVHRQTFCSRVHFFFLVAFSPSRLCHFDDRRLDFSLASASRRLL
jgi:hypothetical protein